MTYSNIDFINLEFGEISPRSAARADLRIGQNGAERIQNMLVLPQGGVRYRNGSRLVHYTRRLKLAWLIPFQFNDEQSYEIELTDQYARFYFNNSIIVEPAVNISNVSQANPAQVFTSAPHGYTTGDEVFLNNIEGMTELNGQSYIITVTGASSFSIADVFNNNINSTSYTAYSSGGVSEKIYEITTPFTEANIPELQFTQNADTMYITSQEYEPRKLTRSAHTNWSLGTFVRTADPFTSSTNWPRTCQFTSDGRLAYAGTKDKPESFWISKPPNQTTTQYDDLTLGTSFTDAFSFPLAPLNGKTDSIRWLTNTDKFMTVGTFGTVRRLFGSTEEQPIAPDSITAKPVDSFGCDIRRPVSIGTTVFAIERGGKKIRSFEYDYRIDGYRSVDRNIISEHLTEVGLEQIIFQAASPNVLWALRKDGVLVGLSYEDKEDKAGWHRHYIGGSGVKVLSIGTMPRADDYEQLWMVVERVINGNTVRTVEYLEDPIDFYNRDDYDGIKTDTASDELAYVNATYEQQKQSLHLDMALTYNGSLVGKDAGADLTFGASTGSGVTVTSSASVFDSTMVGRQIWKAYDVNGDGGGRAEITAYTSATEVTVTIMDDLDNTNLIKAGDWYLTATTISGLNYLEGETVQVMSDGATHPDLVVSSGQVELNAPASVAHVGYGYTGILKTMNIGLASQLGTSQTKQRNIDKVKFRLLHSSALSVGTTFRTAESLIFRTSTDFMDRPVALFSGIIEKTVFDNWAEEKYIYIIQDRAQPLTVLGADIYGESNEE